MKIKLAICLEDGIYQERFVKCVMKHYAKTYEFHVFTSVTELKERGISSYDGFILSECDLSEQGWAEEIIQRTLLLKEDDKYQEVYRIMEAVENMLSNQGMHSSVERKVKPKMIGVYSLAIPALQMPFAITLNDIMGEQRKVMFLDLQEFSCILQCGELGLEDAMTMATTGNFVRSRMQETIGHMQTWDYVLSLKNSRCLLEGNEELFRRLVEYFVSELGYEIVVINLGEIVMNLEGVSSICDKIFTLCPKGNIGNWREQKLYEELGRREKEDVLHRIQRIEIPSVSSTDGDWRKISELWKWGTVGDILRKIIEEEEILG